MNFIVQHSILNNKINLLDSVVSPKNALPILDDIRFVVKGSKLFLTATNLEITADTSIQLLHNGIDGSICLPSKILKTALSKITNSDLSFDINPKTLQCVITYNSGKGKIELQGDNSNDFPQMPTIGDSIYWNFKEKDLKQYLQRSIKFVAEDELRPVMNGVHINVTDGNIDFVATDAHRLILSSINVDKEEYTNGSVVIPTKACDLMIKSLGKSDDLTKLVISDKYGYMEQSDIKVYFRIVEGRYPAYMSVIPKANNITAECSKNDLVSSLDRCSLFDNISNLIKMSFTSESLTISSAMVDLGRSISEKIDCSCSEDIEIGFSHKFFKTCVDTIETNDVTITLSDKTRAVLVMPTDGSYKALCMPMKID